MAATAYLIEDSVRERQAFYSCPVHSCRTACSNLMLVVQHLMNKHILVQEGESHQTLKQEQSEDPYKDSPMATESEEEAGAASPVEVRAKRSSFLSKCEICLKAFASKRTLKKHVMTIHNKSHEDLQEPSKEQQKTVVCEYCSKAFSNKSNLQRHVNAAHKQHEESESQIPVKREQQSDSLSTKSAILSEPSPDIPPRTKQDVPLSKQGKMFKCDICHKGYSYKKNLKTHVKNMHSTIESRTEPEEEPDEEPDEEVDHDDVAEEEEKADLCTLCHSYPCLQDSTFCSSCKDTTNTAFECRICLKVFHKKSSYKQHERDSHNLAPRSKTRPDMFECTFCQKEFDMFEDLDDHVKADHHDLFECSRCNKTFTSHRSLKDHQRKSCSAEPNEEYMQDIPEEQEPAEDDPGLCSACNASPRSSDSPLCSTCRDTERSYECRICQKPFSKRNSLRQHEAYIHSLAPRSKTEPEIFHCVFCKEPFDASEELTEHINNDHIDKLECSICNRVLPNYRSLIDHRRKKCTFEE